MAPPFASTDYNTIIIDSSHLIDRTIKGIDIGLGTIELNNLSASAIASLGGGGGGLTADSVNSSHIINGTIGTEDISDNAITSNKIAIDSINSTHIINGTIGTEDISNNAITTIKIADNVITSNKLQGNSVTTSKIANNTIIAGHLQGNSIITSKILDGNVTEPKLSIALQTKLSSIETRLLALEAAVFP